jgi:hypothetical protein
MDTKILLNDAKIVILGTIVYYFTNSFTTVGYVIGSTLIIIGVYHISILVKFMNDYKEETLTEDENEDN